MRIDMGYVMWTHEYSCLFVTLWKCLYCFVRTLTKSVLCHSISLKVLILFHMNSDKKCVLLFCINSLKLSELHSVHWGINPPLKKHHPFFLTKSPLPPLNLQTVQAPFFRQCPLYFGFSVNPQNIKVSHP